MNEDELKPLVTIQEAATRLGVAALTIRCGLITGALPFGAAIPNNEYAQNNSKIIRRYNYIIPRNRFEKWINGDDLINRVPITENLEIYESGAVFIKSVSSQERGL